MATTHTVISTDDLIWAARRARQAGYNRQFAPEFIDRLDPAGTHVLVPAMPHEHKGGQLTDLHMRTQWYVKVKGSDEPVSAFLDMPYDMFKMLGRIERQADGSWAPVPAA